MYVVSGEKFQPFLDYVDASSIKEGLVNNGIPIEEATLASNAVEKRRAQLLVDEAVKEIGKRALDLTAKISPLKAELAEAQAELSQINDILDALGKPQVSESEVLDQHLYEIKQKRQDIITTNRATFLESTAEEPSFNFTMQLSPVYNYGRPGNAEYHLDTYINAHKSSLTRVFSSTGSFTRISNILAYKKDYDSLQARGIITAEQVDDDNRRIVVLKPAQFFENMLIQERICGPKSTWALLILSDMQAVETQSQASEL